MRFIPRLRWLTLATCLAVAANAVGVPQYGDFGLDTAGMDRSVKPGDDFFSYANGAWVKKTIIPPDRTGFGSFQALDDLSRERTRGLIEAAAAAAGTASDPDTRRIGTFYATYTDEAAIAAKGVAPVRQAFDRIAAILNRADLAAVLGGDQRLGITGPKSPPTSRRKSLLIMAKPFATGGRETLSRPRTRHGKRSPSLTLSYLN